ncbi:hypothetical protein B0H12DRAFT_1099636 [Mycena haematopus]|nr:hypothetical protein B0H12DRAFT_1099636 [Mycena haematopus]
MKNFILLLNHAVSCRDQAQLEVHSNCKQARSRAFKVAQIPLFCVQCEPSKSQRKN